MELDLAWALSPTWRATWKARLEGAWVDARRHDPVLSQYRIRPLDASMQAGLAHKVSLASATHRFFVGLDLERWRYLERFRFPDGFEFTTFMEEELRQSLLLQDLVSAGPWRARLAVQRGRLPLRVDRSEGGRETNYPPTTSWDAGVLHRWSPTLSFYAGAQSSAQWDVRVSGLKLADGSDLPLATLRQVQAGFRSDLLGSEQKALRSVDGSRVQGLELELTGRCPRWTCIWDGPSRVGAPFRRSRSTCRSRS